MWKPALGVLLSCCLVSAQVPAATPIAANRVFSVSADSAEWCGPVAHLRASASGADAFSGNDAALTDVVRTAVLFECPQAQSVQVTGMVDGSAVYSGYAASSDGWLIHGGAAAGGENGVTADANGEVPAYWRGQIHFDEAFVRDGRISHADVEAELTLYPQSDGRIRARFSHCEGEVSLGEAGAGDVPQFGPDWRLFQLVAPEHPFSMPQDAQPLPLCGILGNQKAWIALRTLRGNGLSVRMADRVLLSERALRIEHGTGDIDPVMPAKLRTAQQAGGDARHGDGEAGAALLLLGLFGFLALASMSGGGSSGSSSTSYGQDGAGYHEWQQSLSPPASEPETSGWPGGAQPNNTIPGW